MNDLKYIITYTANLLNNTYLTFSPYRFSLMSIMIGLAALGLITFFVRKLFVD